MDLISKKWSKLKIKYGKLYKRIVVINLFKYITKIKQLSNLMIRMQTK